MPTRSQIRSRSCSGSKDGVALLAVLAFVLLLTILVVGFLAFMKLNRLSTVEYGNQVQAQEIAQGGMQDILSDFHQEIVAGSVSSSTYTQNGVVAYIPSTNVTVVPARLGYAANKWGTGPTALPAPTTAQPTLLPTLVRVSRASQDGTPIDTFPSFASAPMNTSYTNLYSAANKTGGVILNRASKASTGAASVDGRYISPTRWNKPYLLAASTTLLPTPFYGGEALPLTSYPGTPDLPDWVYVTRTGSRVCNAATELTGPTSPLLSSNNLTQNYGPPTTGSNPPASPVIGRYAYVVYDEGALLDANVAGYTAASNGVSTTAHTNVVSNPADPVTGMTITINEKSYETSADLTQLPGSASGAAMTQAVVDAFVQWRNASAAAGGNNYLTSIINGATAYAKNGFMVFQTGDSPLLSRQDLINYAAKVDPNLNTTSPGTATFSQALPYLGTFSRAVSAPSYIPPADASILGGNNGSGNVYAYKTNAENSSGTANRDLANVRYANAATSSAPITHYYDDITVTPGTYTVNSGDPLIQNRFSLAKINWLSQADPNAGTAPSSTYSQAIQSCFGLVWGAPGSISPGNSAYNSANSNTSSSTANGGNPCWNYVGSQAGPSGSLTKFTGTIETLDQVAQEGREPNFFELLKAAILSGSLGLGAGQSMFVNGTNNSDPSFDNAPYDIQNLVPARQHTDGLGAGGLFSQQFAAGNTTPVPSTVSDLQIIKIGADIIDQYDSDSYPTAIYFPYAGVGAYDPVAGANAIYGPVTMVYGDENLPLLNRMCLAVASPNPQGSPGYEDTHSLEGWLQPELWNPHQMPTAALSNAPQNFEIRAYGGAVTYATLGGAPLEDPANPPATWTATNQWSRTISAPQTWYPGINSTESVPAGTITFSSTVVASPTAVYPAVGKYSIYDGPRLLVLSDANGINGITNVTSPLPGSTTVAGNIALSNFPNYSTLYGNGLLAPPKAAPGYFTNEFVGFSTGIIPNADLGGNEKPFYIGTGSSAANCGIAFQGVAPTAIPAGSFALGWDDSNGHFHPYSFITGAFVEAELTLYYNPLTEPAGSVQTNGTSMGAVAWGLADPRTERFSLLSEQFISGAVAENLSLLASNSTYSGVQLWTVGGVPSSTTAPNFTSPLYAPPADGFAYYPQDWTINSKSPLAINRTTTSDPRTSPTYYSDPDGVVRPADGFYSSISSGDGNMLLMSAGTGSSALGDKKLGTGAEDLPITTANSTGSTRHARRPVILNRPFRSIGELGYVFRDMPFKTLDFFSGSSADAALLDVFSLTDESKASSNQLSSVVAGQINLSNAPYYVVLSTLYGGCKKDLDPAYTLGLSGTPDATKISANIVNYLQPATGPNPLINRAAIVTQLQNNQQHVTGTTLTDLNNARSFSSTDRYNKANLEAPVRALADVTSTRTWNLLIDIIAQSGQMSPTATSLDNFVVHGERRYWLHVAIDRYTGKVVAQQLEPVYE